MEEPGDRKKNTYRVSGMRGYSCAAKLVDWWRDRCNREGLEGLVGQEEGVHTAIETSRF